MPQQATDALAAMIASAPQVSLTNSATLYPEHTSLPSESLPLLVIDNAHCRAVIALQGAQLLEFTPHGGDSLLWLSPNAIFAPGKAIRGGIPVCLPWFGVNQQAPDKPKHGFVRNRDWALHSVDTTLDGGTRLCFTFDYDGSDAALFRWPFRAQLEMQLGTDIQLTLSVTHTEDNTASSTARNTARSTRDELLPLSWALHSYHPVNDLAKARVTGLKDRCYLDNTRGLAPTTQDDDITFTGEVDRVYAGVGGQQIIQGQPTIGIRGEGCDSVIVWNPGERLAAQMADIGKENYREFICVERGMAFGDALTLACGDSTRAHLTIAAQG